MQVYVINLERNPERLEFMSKKLNSLKIEFEKINAVDGYALTKDFVESFREDSKRPTGWKLGQIGCFMSHKQCWQNLVDSNNDFALILEDDIHFSNKLPDFCSNVDWVPDDADIVRLESSNNLIKANPAGKVYGRSILKVNSDSWCAGSYVISRKAAQELIKLPKNFWLPTDFLLFAKSFSPIAKKFKIYQIIPTLACQDKYLLDNPSDEKMLGFESDIEVHTNNKAHKKSIKPLFLNKIKNLVAPIFGYRKTPFKT